jgi:hypothetical protein
MSGTLETLRFAAISRVLRRRIAHPDRDTVRAKRITWKGSTTGCAFGVSASDVAVERRIGRGKLDLRISPLLFAKHEGCLASTDERFEDAAATFPRRALCRRRMRR